MISAWHLMWIIPCACVFGEILGSWYRASQRWKEEDNDE